MKSNELKRKGINYLVNCFANDDEQKLIRAKFNNISGKTGQYSVPVTLFQKRTARKNRVLIPFSHIISNNITYQQLDTFEGGVAVEFVNNDFFDQLNKKEENQNEVFKLLKTKLGSNDNVSAIICIRSTGNSSSKIQSDALENLEKYLTEKNLEMKDVLIKRNPEIEYSGQGNDKWTGYVYYSIRGGQQSTTDSHLKFEIPSKDVQLFNPSIEYAGEEVSIDITLVLIYFALFSIKKDNRDDEWNSIVTKYLNYFDTIKYSGKSLKEYVENHICLNLENGILVDPIQVEPIYIEDFTISNRAENSVDITHQMSVNKQNYIWDNDLKVLLTPARPTNLFWSKHLSNMMQQDFSLKEYFIHQRKIIKKWDEFGIENINED